MKILMALWPNPAHLYPFVPLLWGLQAAGHEVRVASHPALTQVTRGSGLAAVPLGEEDAPPPRGPGQPQPVHARDYVNGLRPQVQEAGLDLETWDAYAQFMLPSMWDFHPHGATADQEHPVLDALVDFTRRWQPDLLLWDPCFPAGGIAGDAAGVLHGRMLWGQDYFAWADDIGDQLSESISPARRVIAAGAARHGVDITSATVRGHFTIDPTPDGIQLETSVPADERLTTSWVPFCDQTPVPDWLDGKRKKHRVAVSLGISQRMFLKGGWDHVSAILEGLADVDTEVVATLNEMQLESVGELPSNVRVLDFMSLNQLLPTCDLVIHHGGVGTFATAVATGIPQIITDSDVDHGMITIVEDDLEWSMAAKHVESAITSAQVLRTGAGVRLDTDGLLPKQVNATVVDALHNAHLHRAARQLRENLLTRPSPAALGAQLEQLVADRS